eukprot:136252-Amphidinium_carterae.1
MRKEPAKECRMVVLCYFCLGVKAVMLHLCVHEDGGDGHCPGLELVGKFKASFAICMHPNCLLANLLSAVQADKSTSSNRLYSKAYAATKKHSKLTGDALKDVFCN